MRWFRFAVLVLVASLLQTGLVRVIEILRPGVKPDLLLILLVFFALHASSREAIVASFAIGFAADLSNPVVSRLMGPRMVSFGLFGALLADLNSTLSVRRLLYQAVTIFLMGFLTAGLSWLLAFLRADRLSVNLAAALFWQPLYSAVIGPFLFLPFGWWMRMPGRGPGRLRRFRWR
ncbi:MAG: rod shape-determining protein MreD [Planctomycetes bacterium]|jgi:rod shape-determining protein MreD|nr:rod shape-determining protein MreD [Planctomycetota bacterium]